MRADGSGQRRLTADTAQDHHPDFSPNGRKIVFASDRSGSYGIYEMDLTSNALRRLRDSSANEYGPAYSPNGKKIAFVSDRVGSDDIYKMSAAGSGGHDLTRNSVFDTAPDWGIRP